MHQFAGEMVEAWQLAGDLVEAGQLAGDLVEAGIVGALVASPFVGIPWHSLRSNAAARHQGAGDRGAVAGPQDVTSGR